MPISADQIARVREFNRDYTRRIGVLQEGLLDSSWSLTEVRVLYEIAQRPGITARELATDLELDRGYLSRILQGFESKKLLTRAAAPEDARRYHLKLTALGRRVFEPLERRSQEHVREMLSGLNEGQRGRLLDAMSTIQQALANRPPVSGEAPRAFELRPHRPGDMGWVIQRHGEIYAQEYGWNIEFETLVAEIAAEFCRKLDPARERCWIAHDSQGRRLGCIFLVGKDLTTAKLRLLLVEPDARGMGLGRTLVAECVGFARQAGYQRIVLWTQSILLAARHLYTEAGFRRTAQEPHHSFGHDLVAETWELEL